MSSPAPSPTGALVLRSLPLFPLGTVLYPGGVLPLRIFEVRYLDMIGRCHKAGAPFGIVSLTQGHEVRAAGAAIEAFAGVGTLATLLQVETPQPGLMLIRAEGRQRFRIASRERLKHGLWIADVERIDADQAVGIPPDLVHTGEALARIMTTLAERADGEPSPVPAADTWRLQDCGWVANRWCELLPLQPELKQRMLELDNPLVRLELVGDLLVKLGIVT